MSLAFQLEFLRDLGGEYGVLTRPRVVSPPPKMTTMCHLILLTPCVISSFGPDLTRSGESRLLP